MTKALHSMNPKNLFRLFVVSAAAAALGVAAAKRSDRDEPVLTIDPEPIANAQGGVVASYADVIEPVQNAVVSVYSSKIVRHQVPMNPLFRQFFGDLPDQESREEGLGSGVIVSPDGYILTNNHVVADADELNVSLPDGREFTAELVGTDPKTDVAVIRIDGEDLPAVTLADSDRLRVGDVVFAVGNPLGIGQTVTMGIVSAKGRNNLQLLDGGEGYEDFIQTDAAINMGNSGGALVDAKGRLIGINTAIISTTRGNIGIGFAIPVNLAASIMTSLVKTGSVQRGFLGVTVNTITPELAATLGLEDGTKGVVVVTVSEDSPAEKAGLERGDAIVRLGDREIRSLQDLRLVVSQIRPGTTVAVHVVREGEERSFDVEIGRLADAGGSPAELLDGVTVSPLTDEARRSLGLPSQIEGLAVTAVSPESPYSRRFAPGMVIIEINREPVTQLSDARTFLREGRNLFLIYYRGAFSFLPVQVAE